MFEHLASSAVFSTSFLKLNVSLSQVNDLNVDYLQAQKFTILIRISKSSMAKSQLCSHFVTNIQMSKICDNSAVLLSDNSLASPHFSFRCHFLQQEWIAVLRVFSSKSFANHGWILSLKKYSFLVATLSCF